MGTDTGRVTAMDPVTDTDTGTGLDTGGHMDRDRVHGGVRGRECVGIPGGRA